MSVTLVALKPCFYLRARGRGEIFEVRTFAEARTLIAVGHAQEYQTPERFPPVEAPTGDPPPVVPPDPVTDPPVPEPAPPSEPVVPPKRRRRQPAIPEDLEA